MDKLVGGGCGPLQRKAAIAVLGFLATLIVGTIFWLKEIVKNFIEPKKDTIITAVKEREYDKKYMGIEGPMKDTLIQFERTKESIYEWIKYCLGRGSNPETTDAEIDELLINAPPEIRDLETSYSSLIMHKLWRGLSITTDFIKVQAMSCLAIGTYLYSFLGVDGLLDFIKRECKNQ